MKAAHCLAISLLEVAWAFSGLSAVFVWPESANPEDTFPMRRVSDSQPSD